jgi:Tfp pilus assembly protein PilF
MTHNGQKDLLAYAMSEFLKHNFSKSLELLDELLQQDPHQKVALITRGVAHLKSGHLDEAIADFDRSIKADPSYARAFHMRGLAKEGRGEHKAALADFSKAVELNPEYGPAHLSRSALYAKIGQEDLAAEDVAMVVHLTNVNIESFANASNVWRSLHLGIEQELLESELER